MLWIALFIRFVLCNTGKFLLVTLKNYERLDSLIANLRHVQTNMLCRIVPRHRALWATCEGDKNLLLEKWISIVHHSANIHSWDSADLYHECPHPPIPREKARTKRRLRPGSPAHEALKEVVFDKTLLKDIEQLTLNCHTGTLEVYPMYNWSTFPSGSTSHTRAWLLAHS